MSHTTFGNDYYFIHDGGFDGDVDCVHMETGVRTTIPFEDLKTLVAQYVRNERISRLENADNDEILLCYLQLTGTVR